MHKTKYSCKSFIVIVIIKLYLQATFYLLKKLKDRNLKMSRMKGVHRWNGRVVDTFRVRLFCKYASKMFFQDK